VAPLAPDRDRRSPQHWWEIVVRSSGSELPFKQFYADARLVAAVPQPSHDRGEREAMNLSDPKMMKEEFLEPVSAWKAEAGPLWGDESFSIEQWFNEGEELEFSDIELLIEEPDRWERAVQWMRSLVDAAGIRIS